MFIYTYVYIVQKLEHTSIPRPCHIREVYTFPAIRWSFINITPKKSAVPRLQFLSRNLEFELLMNSMQ